MHCLAKRSLLPQVVTGYFVSYLINKHAGPLERLEVLPLFFLGAAEMVSGISGL